LSSYLLKQLTLVMPLSITYKAFLVLELKDVAKGGGGQVGSAHPKILLAHPRIKVKHIKNKIHLQYLSIICLWFKI
jgi:hypothetical protein